MRAVSCPLRTVKRPHLRAVKRPHLRAVPHPGLPPHRGGRRRCNMQLHYSHVAASSSPIYGGGLRWGTNDLALKETEVRDRRPHLRAVPHPGLPPQRGGRRRCNMQLQYSHVAASSSLIYGGGLRWGTNGLALKETEVGDKRPKTTHTTRVSTASPCAKASRFSNTRSAIAPMVSSVLLAM